MARTMSINVDSFDEETLRAAGLQDGQTVIAEPVEGGLLLRPAPIDRGDVEAIVSQHAQTIERLGS